MASRSALRTHRDSAPQAAETPQLCRAAPLRVVAAMTAPPAGVTNPYVAELAKAAPLLSAQSASEQCIRPAAAGSAARTRFAVRSRRCARPLASARSGSRGRERRRHRALEPGSPAATVVPLNRIPLIRAAVGDKVVNPTDKITVDVIALLFDYIFRDPSIPESLRSLFGRLQVPDPQSGAARSDLLLRQETSHPPSSRSSRVGGDRCHERRKPIASASNWSLTGVIDEVCRDFKVDVAMFAAADLKLQEFVDAEQRKAASLLDDDVAAALVAEETEADRSQVRALIRDRLTGIKVPFEVRGFAETIWVDYLTLVREREGVESEAFRGGIKTLDDLLWSITAKERNAQKARLAKMVPALIRSLRSGGADVQVRDDRMQPFLEAVYKLHMAAIRPKAETAPAAPVEAEAANVPTLTKIANVHDFVGEMVVGTWLSFDDEGRTINARLSWISPMRTKVYLYHPLPRPRDGRVARGACLAAA